MILTRIDPFPAKTELDEVWHSAWGMDSGQYATAVLPRSLVHLGAYDGDRLIGFVNVAWDGGKHAFLLDPSVRADYQRQGIATRLVREATDLAAQRGAHWLHVDFNPQLAGFYAGCGFRPAQAGLIRLAVEQNAGRGGKPGPAS